MTRYRLTTYIDVETETEEEADLLVQEELEFVLMGDRPFVAFTIMPGIEELDSEED